MTKYATVKHGTDRYVVISTKMTETQQRKLGQRSLQRPRQYWILPDPAKLIGPCERVQIVDRRKPPVLASPWNEILQPALTEKRWTWKECSDVECLFTLDRAQSIERLHVFRIEKHVGFMYRNRWGSDCVCRWHLAHGLSRPSREEALAFLEYVDFTYPNRDSTQQVDPYTVAVDFLHIRDGEGSLPHVWGLVLAAGRLRVRS